MNAEEQNAIKAHVKSVLSEIGYKRWEKHMIKCLANLPLLEARKEIERKANEIAQIEFKLNMLN